MSDPLKINSLLGRFKSRFLSEGYGSAGTYYAAGREKENNEENDNKFNFEVMQDVTEHKLFKLGKMVGLKQDEILEALELILKATDNASENADFSTVILANELVKFPDHDDFENKIPSKDLDKIKNDIPDLCLALNNRFEFFCKYPKTLSLEMYKKFSFSETLAFSSKCPGEYKIFSEMIKEKRNNEST